jgi:TonB family protein
MVLVTMILAPALMAGALTGVVTHVNSTPAVAREDGEARWSDWVVSSTMDSCDISLVPDGPVPPEKLRYNCVSHVVVVRNDSSRPLQCRMTLELTAADFRGSSGTGGQEIIFPGREGRRHSLLGAATVVPKSYSSTCALVPAELPPPPMSPEHCTVELKREYLDDYYPRSAMRREEEGAAELDFTVSPDGKRVSEIILVKSSGIESLDQAALLFIRAQRPKTNCPGQRFRQEVRFELKDWMRPAKPQVIE